MGRTTSPPLRTADEIILARCRSYVTRKYYLQLTVFTKWWTEIELLTRAFNGKGYKHRLGYVWVLSKRDDIKALIDHMDPKFPSDTNFESKVIEVIQGYTTKNDV